MQKIRTLMAVPFSTALLIATLIASACASHCNAQQGTQIQLFNNRDLTGWVGDESVWSVQDGMLVGQTTAQNPIEHSTYLFSDITASDFDLSFKYRIVGGNSGVQYRSRHLGDWDVQGYQADIEDGPTYTGALYESAGRGVMALRGEHTTFTADGTKTAHTPLDTAQSLNNAINDKDWNEYAISARGNTLTHTINDVTMIRVTDQDTARSKGSGLFALQVHAGEPMLVQFKDFRLVTFTPEDGVEPVVQTPDREMDAADAANDRADDTPQWIWAHPLPLDNETVYLRRTFTLPAEIESAHLIASGDNHATVFINSQQIAQSDDWMTPASIRFSHPLKQGTNVLAIETRNDTGPAGLAAILEITLKSGEQVRILSDATWKSSTTRVEGWTDAAFDDRDWTEPHAFGLITDPNLPWPDIFSPKHATPIEAITVPDGFAVELLYSAQIGDGSWVSMTFDNHNRIIVSPQSGRMITLSLNAIGGQVESVRPIDLDIGSAQGLLYAYDALYVTVTAPPDAGGGLHRLTDTTGDGHYDRDERLSAFGHMSEHGAHGITLGPDGFLYTVHGNYTPLPESVASDSPFRNYAEDLLLPRLWDPRGHAVGILSPAARVLRTDKNGNHWEIVAGGMRNPYDIAFNADGELFAYDADMEWDIGAPWYRAPRLVHVVSGGEYGWRAGTGKWPTYYPDNLPPVLDTDLSSPTGMVFGTDADFPKRYRKALFMGDWAYGRILVAHLAPQGATYTGTYEAFATGKPLNVTDLCIGPDGAMYFITGGRGTQSGLYRITFVASENDGENENGASDRSDAQSAAAAAARDTRRTLEQLHAKPTSTMLDAAWPHLNSNDRWIRYAARVALEHADPREVWTRTRAEHRPWARLESLLACAKIDNASIQETLVSRQLASIDFDTLTKPQKLAFLRIYMVSFARNPEPSERAKQATLEKLDALYPANSPALNRELSRLLVYLRAPAVADRTLALLESSSDAKQQLHFALVLRLVVDQLDDDAQITYFSWLKRAASIEGGLSLPGFVTAINREALASLSDARQTTIASILADEPAQSTEQVERKTAFVKAWTITDLSGSLDTLGTGRNFAQGRAMFAAAQCIDCHRIKGSGGSTAPDLTGASGRFSRTDLLEAIISPSKIISDQYQTVLVARSEGDPVLGWIVEQSDTTIVVNTDPRTTARITIDRTNITSITPVPVSMMPQGLVQVLTKDEILDLLSYIEAGGDADAPNFK
jgi:putative heme-binding domain-containing protein